MPRVLFVCLGNICRSPMAEALFAHHVKSAGLGEKITIDSCGTGGWHAGELPDSRMRQTAQRHGIPMASRARQLRPKDLEEFDYLIPMDRSNLRHLLDMQSEAAPKNAKILLMRHFDEEAPDTEVLDPYYGGDQGFEEVYHMLDRSTQKLLAYIREAHKI